MTSQALPADLLERVVAAQNVAWYEWIDGDDSIHASRALTDLLGHDPGTWTVPRFLDELHPEDVPRYRAEQTAFQKGDLTHAELIYRLRTPGEVYRWVRDRRVADRDASGRIVRLTGTVTDITEARELEARDRAHAARQAASVEVLRAITASPDDPQPVFELIVRRACELCNAQAGGLFEYDGTLMHIRHRSGYAPEADARLRAVYPRPAGMDTFPGRVVLSGQRVHMPDAQADLSLIQQGRAQGARAYLGVPLLREGRVIGALTLARFDPGEYDQSAIDLVQSFAEQAVIAIESARALRELRERTAELAERNTAYSERIEHQAATIDVLKEMSASPGEPQPVFDQIVQRAKVLCNSTSAGLFEYKDGLVHFRGLRSDLDTNLPALSSYIAQFPMAPTRESMAARVILDSRMLHIRDMLEVPDLPAGVRAMVEGGFYRSFLAIPLLRDGRPIGCIWLSAKEVGGYSDSQVELLRTFAEQAVIAIGSAETWRALQTRTADLQESLEYQTATSDVLKVISRSTFDLQPVLDAVAETAARLCDAEQAAITRFNDGMFRFAANFGFPPAYEAAVKDFGAFSALPDSPTVSSRCIREGRPVHVLDVAAVPGYPSVPIELGKQRTSLGVPLLRDGEAIGVILLARQHVEPFTERQIELVRTFADQAVIAMENARLLSELRDRTAELAERNDAFAERIDHQAATIDVLKAMSASPGDPQPVFDLIAHRARDLCGGYGVSVFEFDGSLLHLRAYTGVSEDPTTRAAYEARYPRPPAPTLPPDRAIMDRQVVRIDDLILENASGPDFDGTVKSGVGVPMMRGGQIIGALGLGSRERGGFSDTQIELLKTFAEQAVIAIGSGETYRALQDRTAELAERNDAFAERIDHQAATIDVLKEMSASPGDPQPVFDLIVRQAQALCGSRNVSLVEYDGTMIHHRAWFFDGGWTDPNDTYNRQFSRLMTRDPDFSVNMAILEGRTIHIRDSDKERGIAPDARAGGVRAAAVVPIFRDGAAVGAIAMSNHEPGGFSDTQIELLQTFAEQAAIAIGSAETYRALQTRTADLQQSIEYQAATIDVLKVMSSSTNDTQPVFDVILRHAMTLSDAIFGALWEYDGALVHMRATRGYDPERIERARRLYPRPPSHDNTVSERAILEGRLFYVRDYRADPNITPPARDLGIGSLVAVPLSRDGATIGCISWASPRVDGFTDAHIELLKTFAEQAVIAMGTTATFRALQTRTADLQESLEYQTATSDVLKVIGRSTFDLQPVLDTVVREAARLCDGVLANLALREGDQLRVLAVFTDAPLYQSLVRGLLLPVNRGSLSGRTVLEQRIVHIDDVAADPEYALTQVMQAGGLRTLLGVPLIRDGEVIGALGIGRQRVEPFTGRQIELISTFADQAVIAIENTRLVTEQREALEQQTATAGVLSVINSNPGELAPVFDTILETAHRLLGASIGTLWTYDGTYLHGVATHGHPDDVADFIRREPVQPTSGVEKLIEGDRFNQIHDLRAIGPMPPGIMSLLVERTDVRTLLAVPLRKDGAYVGQITAFRTEVRPFVDKEITLLENFAAQAVIAMENARLLGELRDRTAELAERNDAFAERIDHQAATIDVLKEMSASPGDPQPVFDLIVRQAQALCGSKNAALFEYDGTMLHLRARLYTGGSPEADEAFRRRFPRPMTRDPDLAANTVIREGRIVHTRDADQEPGFPPESRAAGIRSGVMIPIMREGTAVGTIGLTNDVPGGFSDTQIELLKTFAEQAAIAIASAETYRALQTRTADLREALDYQTATSDVLQVISRSAFDLQPALDTLLTTAARLCEADNGFVLEREGDVLRPKAVFGLGPEEAAHLQALRLTMDRGNVSARAALEGRVVQVADVTADPDYNFAATVSVARNRTILGVPLMRQGVVAGVITLCRHQVRPFTGQQIALVSTFADQAVIAIENTRLLTETREALEQQTATAEILEVINRSPGDLEPVFETILEKSFRLAEAAFGSVWIYEGDHQRAVISRGMTEALAAFRANNPTQRLATHPAAIQMEATKRSVLHLDVREGEGYRAGAPGSRAVADLGGARSMVVVPLVKDQTVIGNIQIYRQEVRAFTEKQVALLEAFAAQAVIAIENARLLGELRERTAELAERNTAFAERIEHQAGTIDVLKAMSASPGDPQPVFDLIVERARDICGAYGVTVWEFDGRLIHWRTATGVSDDPEARAAVETMFPMVPTRASPPGATILDGRITRYDDYETDPNLHASLRNLTVKSGVQVPLVRNGAVIGAIGMGSREKGGFSDTQIELLKTFAEQAVIAITSAETYRALQTRTADLQESLEYQTATSDVLEVISRSTFDLRPVLETLLTTAARLCDADNGGIATVEEGGVRVATHYSRDGSFRSTTLGQLLPLTRASILGRTALEGRIVHVEDVGADPEHVSPAANVPNATGTMLGVPLLRDDVVIGAIRLARDTVQPFTDKQIELVRTFADQAVIAIENTRLLTETREALEQQTATAEILRVINDSPGDPLPVYDKILEKAHTVCGADIGTLAAWDGTHFRALATLNWPEDVAARLHQPFPPEPRTQSLVDGARYHHTPDTWVIPGHENDEFSGKTDIRTVLAVALRKDDRFLGFVSAHRRGHRPYTDKEIALLENFADQAVIAMENARLLGELRERTAELAERNDAFAERIEHQAVTIDVLKTMSASPGDPQPVFDLIVDRARDICEAYGASVWAFDGALIHLRANTGTSDDPEIRRSAEAMYPMAPSRDWHIGRAVLDKRLIRIDDFEASDLNPALRRVTAKSGVIVPLMRGGDVIGAVGSASGDRQGVGGASPLR